MIPIASTGYSLGTTRESVEEWCAGQLLPEEKRDALLRSGSRHFHRAVHEGLLVLSEEAVRRALDKSDVSSSAVDLLIVCHTSPLSVLPLPYTLAGALREVTGLSRAVAFSVTQQQCVSSLHALRVTDALFRKHRRWQSALIVNADIIVREEYRAIGEAGIHSDGAAAVLVRRDRGASISGLETFNDPRAGQGTLPANLFATGNNYVWTLVSVIRKILKGANVSPSDLASVIPHNVNLSAWRQVLSALHVPDEILFQENFGRVGHAFGGDAAINICDSRILDVPGRHLVFASGIGGSFGGFVLTTKEPS